MPKCTIDGKEIEFAAGKNLIDVAASAGISIPYFCYHPGLSVVAQCRMCAVEVEKMPKLQTACSTVATDGMVVHTTSPKTKQNQKSVMEFLLVNHPLDCPICDKAGECDLQDQSYGFGDAYSRYTEERRTYMDLDMGPVIKKNMNRCIHCTRCIRFGSEIAGIREMVAVQRGNNTEITTIEGQPLETEYAGNYADICPTGSLTLKDFRFNKRVWFLKKTQTVCEGCSRGCNIEVHHENNKIERCMPRENLAINKWWMCDEGRFNFRRYQTADRITVPTLGKGAPQGKTWSEALESARNLLKGKKITILVGTDLTQEEAGLILAQGQKLFDVGGVFHFGTPGVNTAGQDVDADKILKRTSKTANLHGIEKLGIKPLAKLNTQAVLVVTGGKAILPDLSSATTLVGIGVFFASASAGFDVILPGPMFAEKEGTIFNCSGVEQKFVRALLPPGQSKALSEILMMWTNQPQTKTASGQGAQAGLGA